MAFRMEVVMRMIGCECYVYGILCISTGQGERSLWVAIGGKRLVIAEVVSALCRNC
jgi:hypothetical protein